MGENSTPGRSLKTLDKAIDIVNYIQTTSGATISEISEKFTLSQSTTHGYVKTMESRGYLVQDNGEFYVGLEFLNKGGGARIRKPEYSMIIDRVDRLAEQTGERAQFIVEEQGRGYYVHTSTGEQAVHVDAHIGKKIHLHASSAGKSILAHLPRTKVDEILERWGTPKHTEDTITNKEHLCQELEQIQDRGFATSDQESINGLRAVGVPIYPDNRDEVIGAISLSAPVHRLKDGWPDVKLTDDLRSTANEIELELEHQ